MEDYYMGRQKINSHIQMPRLILNRFADKKQTIYYIDCHDNQIKRGRAKTLYTELGYYSVEFEEWLNNEIESLLGVLVKFIEATNFTSPQEIDFDYYECAYRYLYSLLARSPYLLDVINDHSVLFQFHDETSKHEMAVQTAYDMLTQKCEFQKGYSLGFINNISGIPFALATTGICQVKIGFICPLTPQRALLFQRTNVDEENVIPLFEITEKEYIEQINFLQYEQEKKHNCNYVISNSKECLDAILSYKR